MKKEIKKITLDILGETVGNLSTTVSNLSTTVGSLSTRVDKLASAMARGFKRMDEGFRQTDKNFKEIRKETKEDKESLAGMVANGFEQTAKDISAMDNGVSSLKESFITLEQGQEDIKLRLDSLTPKFEVIQLEKRVKRLEDHTGIRHSLQS